VLPEDAVIGKEGGEGREFWAHGKNWELDSRFVKSAKNTANKLGRGPYYGSWRLEIKPGGSRNDDRFLHVLTATDTSAASAPKTERIGQGDLEGVAITLPETVRNGVKGVLTAKFLFRKTGDVGGHVVLTFKPDGAESAMQICDRPLSGSVLPQKGLWPLPDAQN
jgi:hypothetical protein